MTPPQLAYAFVVAVLVIVAAGSLGLAVQAEQNAASWKLLAETSRMQACAHNRCVETYGANYTIQRGL